MSTLPKRLQEVADRAEQGVPNKDIATELGISVRTVELYLTRIFRRKGITGNTTNKRKQLRNLDEEE